MKTYSSVYFSLCLFLQFQGGRELSEIKPTRKIVAAFRGMHVSPAKHSFGKCDRKV